MEQMLKISSASYYWVLPLYIIDVKTIQSLIIKLKFQMVSGIWNN